MMHIYTYIYIIIFYHISIYTYIYISIYIALHLKYLAPRRGLEASGQVVAGATLDVQSGRGMNVAVVSTEGALESFQARRVFKISLKIASYICILYNCTLFYTCYSDI